MEMIFCCGTRMSYYSIKLLRKNLFLRRILASFSRLLTKRSRYRHVGQSDRRRRGLLLMRSRCNTPLFSPRQRGQKGCDCTGECYTSKFCTLVAWVWIKRLRGSISDPISIVNKLSAIFLSSTVTL